MPIRRNKAWLKLRDPTSNLRDRESRQTKAALAKGKRNGTEGVVSDALDAARNRQVNGRKSAGRQYDGECAMDAAAPDSCRDV